MSEQHEPRPGIRSSDAERDRSIGVLRDAVGEGRLTLDEFSARVSLVLAARTDRELADLVRDLPGTASGTASPGDVAAPGAAEQYRAFCSHLTRGGSWSLPRRSAWRSIFGTIDLDLRQARLDGPESVLEVYNLFGTVTVIVPDGIEVTVRGGGLFASQKIDSPARPPVAGGPKLTIDSRGPGGTLYVRTRPVQNLVQTIVEAIKGPQG